MKVKRKKLLETLNKVKPGLSSTEIVDQGTCFVFKDDHVYTFNDEVMVCAPFETGVECAVPGSALLAFLGRVSVEELNIKFEKGQFKASGPRVRTGIKAFDEIELPLDEFIDPDKADWKELPKDFLEAISMTASSAGTDNTEQSLECIHIDDIVMETCDNYRLTIYEMDGSWDTGDPDRPDSLIPARNLTKLLNHDPVSYYVDDGWVHFLNSDGSIFSTRPYEDTYEDLDALLDIEGVQIELPEDLGQALQDAEVFVDDSTSLYVKVTIEKNLITVKGEGELGWLEESVRFKYKGEPVSFLINPYFLKSILGVLPEVTIGENAIKFKSDNCVHVISLVA